MIVVLDRQHYGKPDRDDKGAQVEHDGRTIHEIDLTATYIEHATSLLVAEGHTVHVLDSGWYAERNDRGSEIARQAPGEPVAYIACHVNAGGNGAAYGLTLHDERSTGGRMLAESVADALGGATAGIIDRSIVRPCSRGGDWGAAFSTIAGIYDGPVNISGVCFEPFFIDSPAHAQLLTDDGLRLIGQALAVGCMSWAGG